MHINDFVTPESLLREVTVRINDPEYKSGLTRGWYMQQLRDALDELSFDTFFETLTKDFEFPSENFQMELPTGCFNVKEMYLWDGDCCNVATSRKVYWKREFNNMPNGVGYTGSRVRNSSTLNYDPFMPNDYYPVPLDNNNLFWANIQNGLIMFSTSCGTYPKVRLVYSGTMGAIDEVPCIPRFFQVYIKDFVSVRFFETMMARDPRTYATLYDRTKAKFEDPRTGSYYKAQDRAKMMDGWERDALKEYLSHGNW